ncbi:BON domain protein [compost metagenome]
MIKHGYCPTCGNYTAESSYVDPSSLREERLDYQTDAELARVVRDALDEEGVELGGVEIRVLNSVVTLLGAVPSRQDKRMAAEAAFSVPAVIDVNNQLVIARAPERQPR